MSTDHQGKGEGTIVIFRRTINAAGDRVATGQREQNAKGSGAHFNSRPYQP